jgi:hypothetical protein
LPFTFLLLPRQDHRLGGSFLPVVIDFFFRKLKGKPMDVKIS